MRTFWLRFGCGWLVVSLSLTGSSIEAAPQRGEDKARIGNGVLLKRLFGGPSDNKPSRGNASNPSRENTKAGQATPPAPADRTTNMERVRDQFRQDTESLRQRLGWSPNAARDESPANPAPATAVPGRPQSPTNSGRAGYSISDRQDALRLPGQSASAGSGRLSPTPAATARSTPPGSPSLSTTRQPDSILEVPPLELGPRNQPRVPVLSSSGPASQRGAEPRRIEDPRTTLRQPISDPVGGSADLGRVNQSPGAFGVIMDEKAVGPGIKVRQVRPRSMAAHIGLRPGDVIKTIAGLDIAAVEEIDSLVEVLEPEDQFEIVYLRDGKPQSQLFSVPRLD